MRGLLRRRMLPTALALLVATSAAWAHMMPAQQGTLNIVGNAVFAALSLPVSAFRDIDDDADGHLSPRELGTHAAAVRAQVEERLRLFNGDTPGHVDMVMPMAEPNERDSTSTVGSTHVLVLMKVSFANEPRALRIETDLFGTHASERQLTVKATRGKDTEAVVLRPSHGGHAFFRAPWQVFSDYVGVGAEHILGGPDHLLFLLTIIVAAAGWRYWLGVLTSFTVAHSITLTLSLVGAVHVSAAVVEPLIAASIVLMAVLNLRQRVAVPSHRMAVVFACGLLHGLGFASSIADMGLHGTYRAASIVGFNIGIEAGQAAFLAAVLALAVGLRTVARGATVQRLVTPLLSRWTAPQWVSICATILGALWFVERLGVIAALQAQTATMR